MTLKHNKVSGKSNPGDTTIVGGGHWDEDHLFRSSSAGKLLAVGSSDAIVDIGPPDACAVRRPSTMSITDATETTVNFTASATVDFDSNSMFSTSTPTYITIKTAGIYMIQAQVVYPGDADGRRDTRLYNGSNVIGFNRLLGMDASTMSPYVQVEALVECAVNDQISLTVYGNLGAGWTLPYDTYYPRLAVAWLRPAI